MTVNVSASSHGRRGLDTLTSKCWSGVGVGGAIDGSTRAGGVVVVGASGVVVGTGGSTSTVGRTVGRTVGHTVVGRTIANIVLFAITTTSRRNFIIVAYVKPGIISRSNKT